MTVSSDVFYRLTDGSIVRAEKDCSCVTHDGPHWLHMDDLDKKRVQPFYESKQGFAIVALELHRLREKARYMEAHHIDEVIRGDRALDLAAQIAGPDGRVTDAGEFWRIEEAA